MKRCQDIRLRVEVIKKFKSKFIIREKECGIMSCEIQAFLFKLTDVSNENRHFKILLISRQN